MAVTYKMTQEIAEIRKGKRPVKLTLGHWGNAEDKYDIRQWYEDDEENELPGKGITLALKDLIKLREVLNSLELKAD